jgi:DNA-binding transcriptional ArsR family regulator
MNGGTSGRLSPSEVFSLLGSETRIDILQALWDRGATEYGPPVPFSVLFEDVGASDPGNFNYHLRRLRGPIVSRSDDGYRLRSPATRLFRTVLATADGVDAASGPDPLAVSCPHCDGSLTGQYRDEVFTVRCVDCAGGFVGLGLPAGTVAQFELPPAAVRGRTADEALSVAEFVAATEATALGRRVCPVCLGRLEAAVDRCERHAADAGPCLTCGTRDEVGVTAVCGTCRYTRQFSAVEAALSTPAVASFLTARGVTPGQPPLAHLRPGSEAFPATVTVVTESRRPLVVAVVTESRRPLVVAVVVELGDVLTAVYDDAFRVVEVRR